MEYKDLVQCPSCHFQFRTNLDILNEDGKASSSKNLFEGTNEFMPYEAKYIDLKCPNCDNEFEYRSQVKDKTIKDPPIVIPTPNPFWRENAEKLVGESVSSIHDAAKELIVITSLLEGLYFHAITVSELRSFINNWTIWIYLAPIVLWLISLLFAVLTISHVGVSNININSSRNSKEAFERIVAHKQRLLEISRTFLVLSFLPLLLAFYHYLTYKVPI